MKNPSTPFPRRPTTALGLALCLAAAPTGLASIKGPYTPDASTIILLHLDEDGSGGLAANAVSGGAQFVATANPSASSPRQPTPGILGAPGAAGPTFDFGKCANLSFSNSMGLFIDANANGLADLDVNGTTPGADAIPGSTFTGPSGEFTLEALVNWPALTGSNREIVSMDNSTGAGTRPFQFRLGSSGLLEFNNIPVAGANPKTALPTVGPDAFVPNQWFHVAMTYDGAGTVTFYWTKLDNTRTGATVLATHSVPPLDLTASAVLTIGNENRATSGEGLMGLIDEVRISNVARSATDMIFDTAIPPIPPTIDPQPEDQYLGVGETLTLQSHASGTAPLSFRWQKAAGEVFSDLPGQTADTLSLPVTPDVAGDYRYIVANAFGSATSSVARVTVGAIFSGLHPTGVGPDGVLLPDDAIDPHYTIWASADALYLGPDMYAPAGVADYTGNDDHSRWITPGPTLGGVRGVYTYRTTFTLDSTEPANASLRASVLSGGALTVRLNGQPTGVANLTPAFPGPHRDLFNFTLTSGFVAGLNTLDFVVDNTAAIPNTPGGNALRVLSIRGIGPALASDLALVTHPNSQSVREGGRVTFTCLAQGRPPISYQWQGDNTPIPGATHRTLTYNPVLTGLQPSAFKVVVTSGASSLTSQTANLTLTAENHPIQTSDYTLTGYAGLPLTLPFSTLVQHAFDPDGDPITVAGFDPTGSNVLHPAEITQANAFLSYSNAPTFVGSDQFNVVLSDNFGGDVAVKINVHILAAPRVDIGPGPAGTVRLAWPAAATAQGWILRSAATITDPIINAVPGTVVTEGDRSVLYLSPAGTAQFYQLRSP